MCVIDPAVRQRWVSFLSTLLFVILQHIIASKTTCGLKEAMSCMSSDTRQNTLFASTTARGNFAGFIPIQEQR